MKFCLKGMRTMIDMVKKWQEIKKILDGMSDEKFEEMIIKNGHYDIKFAKESLYVQSIIFEEIKYLEKENSGYVFETENEFSDNVEREDAA